MSVLVFELKFSRFLRVYLEYSQGELIPVLWFLKKETKEEEEEEALFIQIDVSRSICYF